MNSMKGKSAMLMTKDFGYAVRPRSKVGGQHLNLPASGHQEGGYPLPHSQCRLQGLPRPCAQCGLLVREVRQGAVGGRPVAISGRHRRVAEEHYSKETVPFFSIRPSAVNGEKFDGCVLRDPVESRMAYQGILDELDPPVDARARRGMSRIDTYPEGTRVAVPWGVYHMPYFRYSLLKNGYVQLSVEEQEVFGLRQIMGIFLFSTLFALVSTMLFVSLFFY
ncbi:hypothetical protein AGDE_09065 [Angomonas deanei]|nr:hypothetical protein AGDE_09065 [Angomonas deanei]|eukprot:EPY31412.1 hypothetical protein AGDE_09065 [Angomonas deanei]